MRVVTCKKQLYRSTNEIVRSQDGFSGADGTPFFIVQHRWLPVSAEVGNTGITAGTMQQRL